ncbi:MAG: hypothetical protein H8K10_02385 [Nitrospira sp.]|nr:hypothetical protein [Nitrospira sp.]
MRTVALLLLFLIGLGSPASWVATARAESVEVPKIYSRDQKPLVPAPKILSEEQEQLMLRDKCLMARPAFGDLGNYWSVGVTASIQAVKYTFGTKQASSAASTGAGVAFRYYGKSPLGTEDAAKELGFRKADLEALEKLEGGKFYDQTTGNYSLPINKISTTCRATTSDIGKDRTEKLASSIFSLTPTVFYVKQASENDISLQPALLIGFFDDIVSVGPGFNLTGPEKGKVFLVLSLGYGFKF